MLSEEQDCSDVLMQIISARKGLKSLAEKLIQLHMHHCIEEAKSSVEGQKNLRDLIQVLERYVD